MIMCYEAGRKEVRGLPGVRLHPLDRLCEIYESMAGLMQPSRVIGIGLNSRLLTRGETEVERERVRSELGLPVCDVYRHGPDELDDAVLKLKDELWS
jgi:uncharacterized NAD-dependent epimerase/dehydratase family protein